jgi:hypothetical protein
MVERLKKAKRHKDIRYQNQPNGTERKEIAALKAERDKLQGVVTSYVMTERELKADLGRLRAALEEILQANKGWDWEEIASQHWDTARRALEGK